MIVFIDESYKKADIPGAKTTLGALLLKEDRSRDFSRELFNLKKRFWKVDQPWDKEIKGRLLLNRRAEKSPKNRAMVEEIIALCREMGIVLLAVTRDGTITLTGGSGYLPDLYRDILWRVQLYMENERSEEKALVVFDSIGRESNRKISKSFTNFMYKHEWGWGYTSIIETPLFADSRIVPGLQIVDVVAYCVNEREMGRRGKIGDFYKEFRDLTWSHEDPDRDLLVWGFQYLPSKI